MKCIYLGCSSFTSKKGSICRTVNFGVPFANDNKGYGFRACNFFVTEKEYEDFLDLNVPCALQADIRFINGALALISYDKKSESMELWD